MKTLPSQLWALIFCLIGVGCLVGACFCHQDKVTTQLLVSGNGLIVGAFGIYQHTAGEKAQDAQPADPTSPGDPGQP